ncbi:A24 family peptidase [Pontiella sp.]|uniref:prepilin peptidase n=1 Tax=Pontiella sp. TaxID=2837462 RepID=UPI003568C69F
MDIWDWYWALVVFAFGACWGSFLNVCIYRIPAELSVVKPRSRCPKCMTNLSWKDNIPIFGWIFLRGKCRYCKAPVSARYPSIELLTALLFTAVWLVYPYQWVVLPYGLLVFGLILGSMVDYDEMWIPDRVTIGGEIIGPILSFLIPAMHGTDSRVESLIASLIGLAVGFGSLYLVSVLGKLILKKDAMGFGDVKLMGCLGAFLGWQSIIFIVFLSSLLGTIVGVTFIAIGKKELQSKIPFGPYISLAAVIWLLGGWKLWAAYLEWMTGAAY